jgi:hypothetical protein
LVIETGEVPSGMPGFTPVEAPGPVEVEPVTEKARRFPLAKDTPLTSTAGSLGTLSPAQQAYPLSRPARFGLAFPGTMVAAKTDTEAPRPIPNSERAITFFM